MRRNAKRVSLAGILALALVALPLEAREIGSWESKLEAVPSYMVYADAGMYLGASPGLGVSGIINVNSLASGLLPFMNKIPKIYLEATVPIVSIDATRLTGLVTGAPYSGQDPTIGALLGFGGDGFRVMAGLDLFQKKKNVGLRWVTSETKTSVSYYPITAPSLESTILMVGASWERSGGAWKVTPATSSLFEDEAELLDGHTLFYQARLRTQSVYKFKYTATALDGEERTYKHWNYTDLAAIASSDFGQYGAGVGFALIGGLVSFKMDFGCVYRASAPGDDILDKLYMPLTFTIGIGGMPIPANANDRYWNQSR